MKTKPRNNRELSPAECPVILSTAAGFQQPQGVHWATLQSPFPCPAPPCPAGPLPIHLLAQEHCQFLQVREAAGAGLHKLGVQGELSAHVVLDGFKMLFWKPRDRKENMLGPFLWPQTPKVRRRNPHSQGLLLRRGPSGECRRTCILVPWVPPEGEKRVTARLKGPIHKGWANVP